MYKVYYLDATDIINGFDAPEPEVILETESLNEAISLACDKFNLGEYHSAWVQDQTGAHFPVGLVRQEDGTMLAVKPA